MRASVVLFVLAAQMSAAEIVAGPLRADLNHDGTPERIWLQDLGSGFADLIILDDQSPAVFAYRTAWVGGAGRMPELSLTESQEIRVTSQNSGIGRTRWKMSVDVAYQSGQYNVVNFAYEYADVIYLDGQGACSFDLTNGQGAVRRGGLTRWSPSPFEPIPVTHWSFETPIPEICFQ